MDDAEAAVIAAAEEHVRACQLGDLLPRPDDCLSCYLPRALREPDLTPGRGRCSHPAWR
jgi:hypothetical protein